MRIDAAATQPVFGGLCHQLIPITRRAGIPPRVAHSSEGCGLFADDAGVCPARPFLRVVVVMASAIVRKPLPKASQRARFNERLMEHKFSPGSQLAKSPIATSPYHVARIQPPILREYLYRGQSPWPAPRGFLGFLPTASRGDGNSGAGCDFHRGGVSEGLCRGWVGRRSSGTEGAVS